MISTGSFELIKNMELKKLLLEMYNHQKDRNFATSTEIDQFNIRLRNEVLDQFRISFNYNSYDGAFYGSRSVNKYKFNQNIICLIPFMDCYRKQRPMQTCTLDSSKILRSHI